MGRPRLRHLSRASAPSPRLVELPVYVPRELAGNAGHRLELLARCHDEPLGRSEVAQEGALASRSDPSKLVEQRAGHRAIAALSVELDRKAMRLVAHPLQEPQGLRVLRYRHGL